MKKLRHCHPMYRSDCEVFRLLDTLRPTATCHQFPSHFLKLGAPVFYRPLASIFSLSAATSTVPTQWKTAASYIRHASKVSPLNLMLTSDPYPSRRFSLESRTMNKVWLYDFSTLPSPRHHLSRTSVTSFPFDQPAQQQRR